MYKMESQSDISGKKIFFLYPHSVIKDEMLDELIMNGFETYPVRDHEKAKRLLKKFPDAIMFVNIDEKLNEKEWETYIRGILDDPRFKNCRLGVMSYNNDPVVMQKYLGKLALPGGYVQLKLGIQESTRIILAALQANDAKGRRKFLRAFCESDEKATMNYKDPDAGTFYGKLLDISAAGFAAKIENFTQFPPKTLLRKVQLKLHAALILTDAVLLGNRRGDEDIYILLTDPKMLHDHHKKNLYHYIKESLQHDFEHLNV